MANKPEQGAGSTGAAAAVDAAPTVSAAAQAAAAASATASATSAPAGAAPLVSVVVCQVWPGRVWQARLTLPAGASVADALAASGYEQACPGQDPWQHGVGIYGHAVRAEDVLRNGDRVEIYRPLTFDPMESRRRRAAHRGRKMPVARPQRTPKARR
ncbi:hypothetical protein CEY04_00915 [Achromobacter sp. HZ28]|nr:hypothetical protein CEY05_00915 [Achromobacter sp. HZ34]OWT81907.1 hypothetical protein CEY04_00915 [Achromobacter sp. HZ28]